MLYPSQEVGNNKCSIINSNILDGFIIFQSPHSNHEGGGGVWGARPLEHRRRRREDALTHAWLLVGRLVVLAYGRICILHVSDSRFGGAGFQLSDLDVFTRFLPRFRGRKQFYNIYRVLILNVFG